LGWWCVAWNWKTLLCRRGRPGNTGAHTCKIWTWGRPFSIPQKSIYLTIRQKCYDNIDDGIEFYKNLKENDPDTYNFSDENELNQLGYKLIEKDQIEDAIKIFELLISEFPKSANAFDSIGEAYYLNGNPDLAIANYKK